MFHEFMQQGGTALMGCIAIVSIFATCIVFERAYFWLTLWVRRDAALRREALEGEPSTELAALMERDPMAQALYWHRVNPARGRVVASRLLAEACEGFPLLERCAFLSIVIGFAGSVVSFMIHAFSSTGADDPGRALYTAIFGLAVSLWCYLSLALFSALGGRFERLAHAVPEVAR